MKKLGAIALAFGLFGVSLCYAYLGFTISSMPCWGVAFAMYFMAIGALIENKVISFCDYP